MRLLNKHDMLIFARRFYLIVSISFLIATTKVKSFVGTGK
nr:MAG TPA: hypothetical protein [Caudoviricetes sp.]